MARWCRVAPWAVAVVTALVASAAGAAPLAAAADTPPAPSGAASPRDPTIYVHAGGIRLAGGTVQPLPGGAVFRASVVSGGGSSGTCTSGGGPVSCGISVSNGFLTASTWDVSETTPPGGWYLNPTLDVGNTSSVSPAPYAFRTAPGLIASTVDVPSTNPNAVVGDDRGMTFSGLLATSLNNPARFVRCGLNIALVLDQSNSMGQGGKQAGLKAAAHDAINALTGTPSTVAIYTFGSGPGPRIPSTSTARASVQPLHSFIDGLPATPSQGSTNWDTGLDQVPNGYDLVILVTGASPTASRLRAGNGVQSSFTDTEQAIFTANRIKAGGARLVGVGIDMFATGGRENLRAVTGPQEGQDYFVSTGPSFANQLRELAAGTCIGELVINKQVQGPSGALLPPNAPDANGWTFSNSISPGSGIASSVTTSTVNGTSGIATAAVTIPGGAAPTVAVTEILRPGYTLVGVQCFITGVPVPTTLIGTTATFVGEAGQPMVCTFTNRQPRAIPTITTFPSPGVGPVGTPIADAVTVSSTFGPTGTVTFNLFSVFDTNCVGPPVFTWTSTLSGGSAVSGSFPTGAVGTYHWVAAYSGDAFNEPVSSRCQDEPVTIVRATPTIATAPSGGGPAGTTISDTAAVSGGFNPTGTVTFQLFRPSDTSCGGPPVFVSPNSPLTGGVAGSGPFRTTEAGTYRWVAAYGGDANNVPVSSGCQSEPVTMVRASPTISTVPSAGGLLGAAIFDTATVGGGVDPTGTVTFELFAPGDTTCGGPPVFISTSPLGAQTAISGPFAPAAAGTYHWIATYSGDANNDPVRSGCPDEPVVIGQAQPDRITTGPSPGGPVGTAIHDTATVSGGASPTGTVTFALFPPGDTTCGGPPVFSSTDPLISENATSGSFAPAAAGSYRWVAIYNGDANNAPARSNCDEEPVDITRAAPAIKTAPSAGGTVGISISDTADVSGGFNPTGSVTFELFPPADPSCGGPPAFITTVPLSGGVASSGLVATTAAGTWRWVATYDGDGNNTPAATHCQDEPVTVTRANPTISTAPSAGGPVGTSLSDTATVSGGFSPTGTVTFELFPPTDTTCGGPPVFTSTNPLTPGGAISGSFTPPAAGTYRWIAAYGGDADNAPVSSGCQDELVTITLGNPSIETTPVAGPIGSPIFDTAAVTGSVNPTGTVIFELFPPGDTTCGGLPVFSSTDPLIGGAATSGSFTPALAGTYRWVAAYSGDANNAPVSSGCQDEPVEITRTTPTITSIASAGVEVGGTISDAAATVSGFGPTGTVTFELFPPGDATCSGPPAFSSTGTLSGGGASSGSFAATVAGTWRWVVVYHGDASNDPVSSDCPDEQVVVSRATPAIASTPSAGGPVGAAISDTAKVSGGASPTGTVTFELFAPEDAACGGPPVFSSTNPLSGGGASSSSFTTAAVGTFRWVATYDGDANNAPISTGCQDEPVTIDRAEPVVLSTPSAGGVVGVDIADAAIVTRGFDPTGTVSFALFGPGDTGCTKDLVAGDPTFHGVRLMDSGASSPAFTTTDVGVYEWIASYSGDANNAAATEGCGDPTEQVVTTAAPPLPPTGSVEPVAGAGGAGLVLSGLLVLVTGRRRRRSQRKA